MHNLSIPIPLLAAGKSYQAWADIWIRGDWRVQDHVLSGKIRLLQGNRRVIFSGERAECLRQAQSLAPREGRQHAVVLLHGLGRTRRCFDKLAGTLHHRGFAVANVAYASLTDPTETHLARLRGVIAALAEDDVRQVSFVGHSLGGLLIRRLLAEPLPVATGRIVFLGTPNQGSTLGFRLSRRAAYHDIFRHGGLQVLPEAVRTLPLPGGGDTLVIAGGNGKSGYNRLLQGDNDGIVTVEETRLDGTEIFMRIPCIHTFLPSHPVVLGLVGKFLQTGRPE